MSSTVVIAITPDDGGRSVETAAAPSDQKKIKKLQLPTWKTSVSSSLKLQQSNCWSRRRAIHGIKVGIALVLVSLLYLLDPIYEQVGENAMWAIMTVVVVFEFYAGATLSKGLNRGLGTVLGGGFGFLAAIVADRAGGKGNPIIISISLFVFGGVATYSRLVPRIKRRYEYGAMIFLLTFSLVAVSGLRAEKIMELAFDRLKTIGMGFAICIFVTLLFFPAWAGDDLHRSTASKFETLASSIEGCLEEYFDMVGGGKEDQQLQENGNIITGCKAVLNSKSTDESLANFARWEPWHGKFGFKYPWEKYIKMGDDLRELAATLLSLQGCLQSPRQATSRSRDSIREPVEVAGLSMAWSLREIGESMTLMKRCRAKALIDPKLRLIRLGLNQALSFHVCSYKTGDDDEAFDAENLLAMATFLFLLMEVAEKIQVLAMEVEELGEVAAFQTK